MWTAVWKGWGKLWPLDPRQKRPPDGSYCCRKVRLKQRKLFFSQIFWKKFLFIHQNELDSYNNSTTCFVDERKGMIYLKSREMAQQLTLKKVQNSGLELWPLLFIYNRTYPARYLLWQAICHTYSSNLSTGTSTRIVMCLIKRLIRTCVFRWGEEHWKVLHPTGAPRNCEKCPSPTLLGLREMWGELKARRALVIVGPNHEPNWVHWHVGWRHQGLENNKLEYEPWTFQQSLFS